MDTNSETVTNTGPFSEPTWAILELMGHRRKIGRVTQVEVFGAKMCRIEVLQPGTDPGILQPGDVAASDKFHTELYGGSSIYALTPVDEKTARFEATRNLPNQAPVDKWSMREAMETDLERAREVGAREGYDKARRELLPPPAAEEARIEEPAPHRPRDEREHSDEDDDEPF